MGEDVGTLSERERETLRLLLVGHNAKSIAYELGLSVHTVNERLREARRKLRVSSSREAARMFAKAEHLDPYLFGNNELGVGTAAVEVSSIARNQAKGWGNSLAWLGGGMLTMSLLVAAFVFSSSPYLQAPAPAHVGRRGAISTEDIPTQKLAREVETMASDISEVLKKASPDNLEFHEFLVRQVYVRSLSQALIFKVGPNNRVEALAMVNVSPGALEAISAQAIPATVRANHEAVSVSTQNWRGAVIRLGKLDNTFLYAGQIGP